MADIKLVPLDEVYYRVECDDGINMELYEFMTFAAPNHQFHPLFKKGRWDGKIKLLNMKSRKVYRGLEVTIRKFCEERGYTLEVPTDSKNNVSPESIEKWINESLRPTDENGERLIPRAYQLKAIYEIIRNKRRIILSPTGSGKSLIAYCATRFLSLAPDMKGKRVLIIVPTIGLVNQMYNDFKEYSQENGWDVEKNVHKIFSGQEKVAKQKVFISTWQSIYEFGPAYFKQFGAIICDEVHTAEADSIKGIMERSSEASYRVGMTGTLKDALTHKLVLKGLFGAAVRVETTKAMQDRGELADLDIHMMILKHTDEDAKALHNKKAEIDAQKWLKSKATRKYFAEMEFLCQHQKRNLLIRNLTLKQTGNTLVLFQYVEKHGFILRDLVEQAAAADRKVFFVYQGTSAKQREEIRKIVSKEKDAIIIASYGTFSTGVNIKNIGSIIFASPSKSKIRILQSIGRGLRVTKDKTHLHLFDISDDLTFRGVENSTIKHLEKRLDIYTREQFKYKLYKLEL